MVKNPAANAGDVGLIPGSGRSPEEGNGNPLQYSCLGNPWTEEPCGLQSTGLRKNWTGLSDETATTILINHMYLSQLANFQLDGFFVHLENMQEWSWKPELTGFPPELFTFVSGGNECIPSTQEAQSPNAISHSTSSTSRKDT